MSERPDDLALDSAALAMPPAIAARTLRRLQWARWGALRWVLPLAVVAIASFVISGSHTPWEGDARFVALGGLGVAVALCVGAGVASPLVLSLAFAGAAIFAAAEGRAAGFGGTRGWHCTLTEWVIAAGPLAALWWYSRREVLRFRATTVAAVAAASALAGDAVLHVLCAGTELAPHVWLFHFGGVLAIAGVAAAIARPPAGA